MLCDNCKLNTATILYKHFVDNQEISYNLCNLCYKKLDDQVLFFDIFKDLFLDLSSYPSNSFYSDIVCDNCGNTLEHIKNSGKMGCFNCYSTFKQNILPIIKNIQFDNTHTGKLFNSTINKNQYDKNYNDNYINSLKQKLKTAVDMEDYELAIKIRDEIKNIKKG